MTPYEMELLIHLRTRFDLQGISGSNLKQETLDNWESLGVVSVDREAGKYVLTGLGVAWLEDALNTDVPRIKYINRHGEIIEPWMNAGQ